jgi:hypothetical protein
MFTKNIGFLQRIEVAWNVLEVIRYILTTVRLYRKGVDWHFLHSEWTPIFGIAYWWCWKNISNIVWSTTFTITSPESCSGLVGAHKAQPHLLAETSYIVEPHMTIIRPLHCNLWRRIHRVHNSTGLQFNLWINFVRISFHGLIDMAVPTRPRSCLYILCYNQ